MSRQSRETARTKIDRTIEAFVNQEKDAEDAEIMKDALEGCADVVFGIWKSLENIADRS